MSLIIDLIIIAAAVASIYLGLQRGFIKSVMSFLSLLIAIAAVFVFIDPVSDWFNERVVSSRVDDIVEDSLESLVNAGEQQLGLTKLFDDRPDALVEIAERFSFDIDAVEDYYRAELEALPDSEAFAGLVRHIAEPTAAAISDVAAALGIFIAALIVLHLVTFILDLICRLPVLRILNRALGFLFGVGSALVSSWVISNIAVGFINAMNTIDSSIFNQSVIDGTIILRFFYNNSLILFNN